MSSDSVHALRKTQAAILTVAVVAGILAGLIGEGKIVQVEAQAVPGEVLGNPMMGTTAATEQAAVLQRAARSYGLLGLLLGLGTGAVALGLPRKGTASPLSLLAAAGLGAAAASLAALVAVPLFFRYRGRIEIDLLASLAIHAAIWIPLAVGVAIGFGLASGARGRTLLQRVLPVVTAVLVGTVVYEMLGAILLANDDTGEPIASTTTARILANLIVALFVGIGLALSLRSRNEALSGLDA